MKYKILSKLINENHKSIQYNKEMTKFYKLTWKQWIHLNNVDITYNYFNQYYELSTINMNNTNGN